MQASYHGWIFVLFLSFNIRMFETVDRNNFKTCQQSGFCKRQRKWEMPTKFNVLDDSIEIQPTFVRFLVSKQKARQPLVVELFGLVNNSVRLKVKELNPEKPRYEIPVGDVLLKEPEQQRLDVQKEGERLVLKMEAGTIVVTFVPFTIDILSDERRIFSINSLGLMKYEQTRIKKAKGVVGSILSWATAPFRSAGTENAETLDEEEEDETDAGEEMFHTHKDSKPNGPTSVGLDITFAGYKHVYGIPEHADTLVLKSTNDTEPYRLYNLDVFEYELYNPMALYGSVPLMIGHNTQQTVGLLWLNAAETWIDIDHSTSDAGSVARLSGLTEENSEFPVVNTHWFSESGIIDAFFFMGPTSSDVFLQYSSLTGTTPLPPLFSLGYHQSRWNYIDEEDIANLDHEFDEHNIPVDVLWLDIEHTDGKRYFTWDSHKFRHPEEMLRNVSRKARKMVTSVDPHLKRDKQYSVYSEAQSLGYLIVDRDGNEYEGWCWPGSSSWLDFTNPAVEKFWAEKFQFTQYKGSTKDLFTWNDMNEPSVFNGPEITMHKDAKHFNGWEHRDLHNVFGLYVHRASINGQLLRSDNCCRPFVLARSFFAGSQRYGAVWTGDNAADWGHLKISLSMMMSLNLVGITFSGADIGGFFKNPDEELLTRWYQAGAFQPFFRAHAHLDTRRREPWLQSTVHLAAIREAIVIRYRLLLYWYLLFFKAERSGGPIMKPLWVEFPSDPETFTIEDEHMVGSALLVHPVTETKALNVSVFLPGSDEVWYDFNSFQLYSGNQTLNVPVNLLKIPLFYRGGFILPLRERIRRSSTIAPEDPVSLFVTLSREGNSKGELFFDDFHSFAYQKGHYIHREFRLHKGSHFTSRNLNPSGSYKTSAWIERIYILGLQTHPTSVILSVAGSDSVRLDSSFSHEDKLFIIRKPGVNIATDFDIVIE